MRMVITQTKVKRPYSKLPIRRARMICETKAMAALTTRMANANKAMRWVRARTATAAQQRPQLFPKLKQTCLATIFGRLRHVF